MSNLVTLRPGARGTIRLVRQYGAQLIFVRYRYDEALKKRFKTVELIIDEQPWTPRLREKTAPWMLADFEETDLEKNEQSISINANEAIDIASNPSSAFVKAK